MTHLIREVAGEGTQRIQSLLNKIHVPNVLFGKKDQSWFSKAQKDLFQCNSKAY